MFGLGLRLVNVWSVTKVDKCKAVIMNSDW